MIDHPHALSAEQMATFDRDGYLILRDVLPPSTRESLYGVFSQVVDRLAQRWLQRGLISDTFEEFPLEERYMRLLAMNKTRVPAAWRRILVSRPVFELWRSPELLGPVRSLIGDEVYAHGVWNGRPRDPFGRSQQVQWHQDAHYYKGWDPMDGRLISAWIPLVPVDARSACLQFVAGSHTKGWIHRTRLDNGEYGVAAAEVDETLVRSAVMNPGDVVLFTDTTLHQSTPNLGDRVRWSIDIRFARAAPKIMVKTPRGHYCFSGEDATRAESFETWAARYLYQPEELLDELTNFEEGYDIEVLKAFSRTSPFADVY